MGRKETALKTPITIGRTFATTPERLWELWTTKQGIESWWGPEGFTVQVLEHDLRPGGRLHYAMTATAPETVAFMKQASLPLGYLGGIAVFGGLLSVLACASLLTRISRTALFWAAFIVTRPLGAVVGDFLDKPRAQGGRT